MNSPSDQLFTSPTSQWIKLDPNYLKLLRISVLIVWPIIWAIPVIVAFVKQLLVLGWVLIGVAIAFIIFRFIRQRKIYLAWGYALQNQDLYVTWGPLWRHLKIVPFGRIQAVTVDAGPFSRLFGLATVSVITAAAEANTKIPGLSQPVAQQLRDQLVQLSENQAAGL